MSADYLATITALADAWEVAYALLRKRVIAFLAKKPNEILPRDLALSVAIDNLAEAVHRRVAFHRMAWLVVGAMTVNSLAEADYQLECMTVMANKAGLALQLETLLPPERADAIRAWLASEQKRALQESLSDPERKALRAMFVLKAFTQESRQSIAAIAQQAEKKQWANAGPYRNALPCLVDKTLAKTKEGRGGGAWLTPDGHKIAKAIRLK
jgi:hypothetical protein